MYTITKNNGNIFVTVKSTFADKETGEQREFNSKYKVANWIQEATITEWLDNQNPDFLNKNIRDYLVPQGIVTESGSKKLIGDMLAQME